MAKGRRSKDKIDIPWRNFIFCPVPIEQSQFQSQLDEVQSIVVEMIIIGRGLRLEESKGVNYEEAA